MGPEIKDDLPDTSLLDEESERLFNLYRDGFRDASQLILNLNHSLIALINSDPEKYGPVWEAMKASNLEAAVIRDKFKEGLDDIRASVDRRLRKNDDPA